MKELPLVLADGLPERVDIGGASVPIETDWRVWVLIDELLTDARNSDVESESIADSLAFGKLAAIGSKTERAEAIRWFYLCGEPPHTRTEKSRGIAAKVCDLRQDWGYIYAAFLQLYGIDLINVRELHWWQFRALLAAITDGCEYGKIIGYRSCDLGRIKDKELRRDYARLKAVYQLDATGNAQDKTAAAGGLFAPPEKER